MKSLWVRGVAVFVLCLGLSIAANAQTDIAASVYGAFNGTTDGNGTIQSPSNGAGALIELRHIANPLVGLEVTYAFNRANQQYTSTSPVCPGGLLPCSTPSQYVPSNAHEVTADYLVSFKVLNMRPFLLAGGGVLFSQATGNSDSSVQNQTQGVLVYGGGLDFTVLPHIGIRGQYRGNVYSAPQLAKAFSSTKAFTTTSEPMLGVFVRF